MLAPQANNVIKRLCLRPAYRRPFLLELVPNTLPALSREPDIGLRLAFLF